MPGSYNFDSFLRTFHVRYSPNLYKFSQPVVAVGLRYEGAI